MWHILRLFEDVLHAYANRDSNVSTVAIDHAFKDELLAAASKLAILEPKQSDLKDMQCGLGPEHFLVDSKVKQPPCIGLLSLPSEILLSILELLEDDLFMLSQLSRRLHHLALPVYLARKGFNPFDGEIILFDERSAEAFTALSSALFRPTLNRVWCTFSFNQPQRVVLQDVRKLNKLIDRLDVLREAHLDFSQMRGFVPRKNVAEASKAARQPEMLADEVDSQEFEVNWERELIQMFDKAVGKECRTLTVCSAGWDKHSTPRELADALQSSVGFKCRLWGNLIRGVRSPFLHTAPMLGKPPDKERSYMCLKTFNIHSVMLLSAEICPWTIQVLNTSSVSTLSLERLDIHPDAWAVVLPYVTIPSLTNLIINHCNITPALLTDFLQRHPSVRNLSTGHSPFELNPPSMMKKRLSSSFSQNLTHISASPSYLNRLLALAGLLDNLQSITIIVHIHHGHLFDLAAISLTLASLSRCLLHSNHTKESAVKLSQFHSKSIPSLALDITFDSSTDDWMLSSADTQANALLRKISTVRLNVWHYLLPQVIVTRLPRWLESFSGLKEFKLRSPSETGPIELKERLKFVSALFKRCRLLEKVDINGGVILDTDALT